MGRLLDHQDPVEGDGIVGQIHESEGRASQDRGQQVVEVVGDAPRHDAETLELLRLLHLVLELPPLRLRQPSLGDVAVHGNEVHRAAGGLVRETDPFEPPPGSVPVSDPVGPARPGCRRLDALEKDGYGDLDVVGMQQGKGRRAHHFLGLVAEDAFARGAHVDEPTLAVHLRDQVPAGLGDRAVSLLALVQLALGLHAIGHVARDDDHAQGSIAALIGLGGGLEPPPASVPTPHAEQNVAAATADHVLLKALHEPRAVVRVNVLDHSGLADGPADQLRGFPPEDLLTVGAHEEKAAIGVELGDEVVGVLGDGPEAVLAVPERIAGELHLGDVPCEGDDPHFSVVAPVGAGGSLEPDPVSRFVPGPVDVPGVLLGRDDLAQSLRHLGLIFRVDPGKAGAPLNLFRRVAQDLVHRGAHVGHQARGIDLGDHGPHALENPAVLLGTALALGGGDFDLDGFRSGSDTLAELGDERGLGFSRIPHAAVPTPGAGARPPADPTDIRYPSGCRQLKLFGVNPLALEGFPYLADQHPGQKRLVEEARQALADEGFPGARFGIAADQHNPNVGPDFPKPFEGLLAAHGRHGAIEEHQLDLVGAEPEDLDGLRCIGHPDDIEAGSFKGLAADLQYTLVVIDHQDRSTSPPLKIVVVRVVGCDRRLLGNRKEDAEARAGPGLRLDFDRSPVGPNDSQDGGEAQSASGELRGVERIEDARARLGIDAATVVAHFQSDVGALGESVTQKRLREGGAIRLDGAGADDDSPGVFAEGLGCVGDQAHGHLAQLGRIGLDGGEVPAEVVLEDGLARGRTLDELGHFANDPRDVEALGAERLGPGIGQHLAGQGRRPVGRVHDPVEPLPQRRLGWQVHQCEAGFAQDRGEQVIEVVSDASGHDTQALQLLGVLHPVLEPAAILFLSASLRDVVGNGDHVNRLVVGSVVDTAGLEPSVAAVAMANAERNRLHWPDRFHHPEECRDGVLDVLGVQVGDAKGAEHLLRRVAQQLPAIGAGVD